MKQLEAIEEDSTQKRLRGLEAALAAHLSGHSRIENQSQLQELREEINRIKASLLAEINCDADSLKD
jgi:hypothetical protein